MNLSIYDKDLNRVLIIGETFISCLWSEGYNTSESFSLELNATDDYKDKIKVDYFVGRNDRNTLMVIKSVEIGNGKIIASGAQATRILDDIAFIGTITSGADIEGSVAAAYDQSAQHSGLAFTDNSLGLIYEHDISNKSFKELCETMGDDQDAGLRLVRTGNGMEFSFYKPVKNDNLVFSEKYGNLTLDKISTSYEQYKNYAIVLGEGEGTGRVRVDVDKTDGEDPKELIVDARDISREDSESISDYEKRLEDRGNEKLLETQKIFTCAFTPYGNDFGSKYDLGDILTIYATNYGITISARVAKFTQKAQGNKTTTTIEVGNIIMKRRK